MLKQILVELVIGGLCGFAANKIMNGRKKQLFFIQLSFLPLWLVGLLSFGVAMFWIIPYQRMTYTLYYLDIMKPQDN